MNEINQWYLFDLYSNHLLRMENIWTGAHGVHQREWDISEFELISYYLGELNWFVLNQLYINSYLKIIISFKTMPK